MFTRLQNKLRQAQSRLVQLSPKVHEELCPWRQLAQELADCPTHPQELDPFLATWEGTIDASGTGVGGVFPSPYVQLFVWRYLFAAKTQAQLVLDTKPEGDVTTNDLELAVLFAQVQLFAPAMDSLAHIRTTVDNTAAQGWANQEGVITATAVGPILQDLVLLTRNHKIYSSVWRISGTDNKMDDAASCLTHLTDKVFLHHFTLTFPQRKPWRLLALPPGCKQRLTSMLHIKRCCVAFPPQSTRKTQRPGANGASSANGW